MIRHKSIFYSEVVKMNVENSCKFITDNAQHVFVDEIGMKKISNSIFLVMAKSWTNWTEFCAKSWKHPLRSETLDADSLSFIFLCGAWNYCFWPNPWEENFGITIDGTTYYRSWVGYEIFFL